MDASQAPAGAAAAPPAPPRKNRLMRVVYGIVGVISVGIGLLRLVDALTLPSCTSDTTRKTIVGIGKDKDVAISGLTDIKSRESTGSDIQCSATMAVDDGKRYAIDYHAFWEGWSAKIIIDKVEPI
jgi:hypothetical protein